MMKMETDKIIDESNTNSPAQVWIHWTLYSPKNCMISPLNTPNDFLASHVFNMKEKFTPQEIILDLAYATNSSQWLDNMLVDSF